MIRRPAKCGQEQGHIGNIEDDLGSKDNCQLWGQTGTRVSLTNPKLNFNHGAENTLSQALRKLKEAMWWGLPQTNGGSWQISTHNLPQHIEPFRTQNMWRMLHFCPPNPLLNISYDLHKARAIQRKDFWEMWYSLGKWTWFKATTHDL